MSTITVTIAVDGETFHEQAITDSGHDVDAMRTVAGRLAPIIRRDISKVMQPDTGAYREKAHLASPRAARSIVL